MELWTNTTIIITGAFTNVIYSFLFPMELVFNIFGIHNFKIKELVAYNAYKEFYWLKSITNIAILCSFIPFCVISNNVLSWVIISMLIFCVFSNVVVFFMSLSGKI
jgi:hypothetical protein